MSYMNPFKKIVTLTKRNHIYYGQTESHKVRSSSSEIATDLSTVFNEIDSIETNLAALASGYLMPSGFTNSLYDLKRQVYDLEKKFENRIYVQAN